MAWADSTFFHPNSKHYDVPREYGLRCEDSWIPSGGETLHGWFFPAEGASPLGTVLHCHGNAANITAHFHFVAWLPEAGWNVLCFDYRGYGRSTGRMTRAGGVEDCLAALAHLRTREDVDAERIVLFGQSLGGTLAIVALTRPEAPPVAGLCIDGAFSSYRREAREVCRRSLLLRPWAGLIARHLVSDELSPSDFAERLPAIPKLFICGIADSIVDYRQTMELCERASEPKELWVLDGAEHTEVVTSRWPGGRERVLDFLNRCVGATAAAAEPRRR